ncbi:MAG: metalloregulator ArsR/SmtB family transcription factor [Gammaproteobacteria bacterium]|jgi:ArsR family transcriptional regulator|nr:metalloregulator ArsR/SmtB family transcription factor [Gammaproteobacteria bacterium]MBQ0773324.1 metalloregulator ArsR/SmtB family transcription factor [Gammaproteobacteria bacterium]
MSPVELCKCLADDTRLRLVVLMRRYGELCVCDLVDALQLPQSTVSRHLSQLRGCGLVSDRREGQWVHYQLAAQMPEWALAVIDELMQPATKLYRAELKRGAACCQ